MEDYIETVLSKKTNQDSDIINKPNDEPIHPVIQKQIDSLLKTLEKNNIPLDKALNQSKK